MSSLSCSPLMAIIRVVPTKKVYPTGDPSFAVMQSFPAAISAEDSDPFLMCDHFGPFPSRGVHSDPDSFPINWHPHRGMDILTYLLQGVGRHADSLGNRETYRTPGLQWISVGSGVEHAEGGGTPEGEMENGFQIWVNVPSARKMDDPRYGTEPPENIPYLETDTGAHIRVIAGKYNEDLIGPFQTIQHVQILDVHLDPKASLLHSIPQSMNNCLLHIHDGSGLVNGVAVQKNTAIHLDATNRDAHQIHAVAADGDAGGMKFLIFAGEKLSQSIAWHGPFVMTTDQEIQRTIHEYRSGTFLRKRVPWDYKKIHTKNE